MQIAGYGSNSDTLNVKNNFSNFAPRLGVAYQVLNRTVVRAGYGIVYGQGWAGDTFGGVLTSSFPTQVQQTVPPISNAAAVFTLAQGPPRLHLPGDSFQRQLRRCHGNSQTARPTQVRLPTVAGWNVMLQQELTLEHVIADRLRG